MYFILFDYIRKMDFLPSLIASVIRIYYYIIVNILFLSRYFCVHKSTARLTLDQALTITSNYETAASKIYRFMLPLIVLLCFGQYFVDKKKKTIYFQ